jgi:broad specificity phosphatase PhoE
MNTIIYLIRHATPDWSRFDLRYDIPPGPPLTAQGEEEAVRLGDFLRATGVRKMYASPLERSQRTAQIVGDALQIPIVEEAAIAEWRQGEAEHEVLNRFNEFWQQASAESAQTGPLALISHGGPIRLMLVRLGLDSAELAFYRRQFDRDNPLPPAGVWQATHAQADNGWQVELVFTPRLHQVYTPEVVFV